MKNPILLKLLQNSVTTSKPNYKHTASRKSDAGFTLLELIVIVILLGTLAAIAAPSWLGFINRQRVRTVNDRVLQSLRTAQSEAKRTKVPVTITFSDISASLPTASINGNPQQLNGGGEIKPNQVKLFAQANGDNAIREITFDYQGNISSPSIQSRTPRQLTDGFTVTISPANSPSNTSGKQCVIVETLIGAMRTAEGSDCPPPPS